MSSVCGVKTNNIIKGMQILEPYYSKPDGYHTGADHDVIYAYATDSPLSEGDIAKMIELGWHQEHDGRNYENEFSAADYRQEESWIAYC